MWQSFASGVVGLGQRCRKLLVFSSWVPWSLWAWHEELEGQPLARENPASSAANPNVSFLLGHGMCRTGLSATCSRAPGPEDFKIWANFATQTGDMHPVTWCWFEKEWAPWPGASRSLAGHQRR